MAARVSRSHARLHLNKLVVTILCTMAVFGGARSAAAELHPSVLEPVFDDIFSEDSPHRYEGAVVAVVHKGEIVFIKGYGHESPETGVPVDPVNTRFRMASVTKTFAAVALGQMFDRGLITSIDDPANIYLTRYQLPKNHGQDITLRHLATHTVGYEDRALPLYDNIAEFPALDVRYLRSIQPKGDRPPGHSSVYSNFGSGLIGVVVEDITGMTFAEYLQENIFNLAGMPGAIVADAPGHVSRLADALSYYPNGDTTSVPNNWSFPPVTVRSGGATATGKDMAAYMLALLDEEAGALLGEAGRRAVFTRHGGNHDAVDGFGTLFFMGEWNGVTHYGHTGYMPGFRTSMLLIPEHDTGVFVSVTGEPGRPGIAETIDMLQGKGRMIPSDSADKRYPPTLSILRAATMEPLYGPYAPPAQDFDASSVDLGAYVGRYHGLRRAHSTITKAIETLFLPGRVLTIKEDGEGGLEIGGRKGYAPVAEDVFWRDASIHGGASGFLDIYAFTRNEDGSIAYVSYQYGNTASEPVTGFADPATWKTIFLVTLALLLTGLLAVLWPRTTKADLIAKTSAIGLAVLMPLSVIVYFSSFAAVEDIAYQYLFALPQNFIGFVLLTNLLALLAVAFLVAAPVAARGGQGLGAWVRRIHFAFIAAGAVGLLALCLHLNLVGVNLP